MRKQSLADPLRGVRACRGGKEHIVDRVRPVLRAHCEAQIVIALSGRLACLLLRQRRKPRGYVVGLLLGHVFDRRSEAVIGSTTQDGEDPVAALPDDVRAQDSGGVVLMASFAPSHVVRVPRVGIGTGCLTHHAQPLKARFAVRACHARTRIAGLFGDALSGVADLAVRAGHVGAGVCGFIRHALSVLADFAVRAGYVRAWIDCRRRDARAALASLSIRTCHTRARVGHDLC